MIGELTKFISYSLALICSFCAAAESPSDPLRHAITNNDLSTFKQLLNTETDEYERRYGNLALLWGTSFLQCAVASGQLEVVQLVIEMDPTLDKSDFSSALLGAAGGQNTEIVKLLLSLGADVNAQTSDGTTALHCAVRAENFEAIQLLVKAGANIWAEDCNRFIPAHMTNNKAIKRYLANCRNISPFRGF